MLENIKENVINLMMEPAYKPMKKDELAQVFVETKEDRQAFFQMLDEMKEAGDLFINSRNKVGSLENFDMKRGIYGY